MTDEQIVLFESDFAIVADYLVHRRDNPDYRPEKPRKFVHAEETLDLMAAVTGDERFIEAQRGSEGRPKDMCEVLDRVEAKGREQGREQEHRRGLNEKLEQVANAVRVGALALSDAAALFGFTEDEIRARMQGEGQLA